MPRCRTGRGPNAGRSRAGTLAHQASAWAGRTRGEQMDRAEQRSCGGALMGVEVHRHGPVAEVVVNYPPVNALPVAGWFDLADAVTAAGRDESVHVVVLRAEGRGFNAGVDIKEMQR